MSARHQIAIGPIPTAEERAAIYRRLRGPAKVINIHQAAKVAVEQPREPADAHVRTYEAFTAANAKSFSAASYFRFLCEACSVSYEIIRKPCRLRQIVSVKHWMVAQIHQRYPNMSMPEIGKLFGGLDHTSVLHALRKHGYRCGNRNALTQDKVDQIIALHANGYGKYHIAEIIGCQADTVRAYLDPEFRDRRREWNRKQRQKGKK